MSPLAPDALRHVRALSFDLFGTLVNYDIHRDELAFLERVLPERGVAADPAEVLRRWLDASLRLRAEPPFTPVRDALARGLALAFRELAVEDDAEPYVRGLLDLWVRLAPYPEVAAALDALRGWPAVVVSNYDEGTMRLHLALCGLAPRFRDALSSEAARCYKPSPAIFHEACRRLGLPPAHVLHVGDSPREDVLGAKRAGLRACFVDRAGREPPSGADAPDLVVRDLADLAARLGPAPG